MRTLSIDIETYSSVNLRTCGLYKYVESPDFEVLMIAYAFDDHPVRIFEPSVLEDADRDSVEYEKFDMLVDFILDGSIKKTAYNAAFEIACLSKMLGVQLDPMQWECTMVMAAQAGYPFGLDKVSSILGTAPKDKEGDALIKYFSVPCKATKTNEGRLRNMSEHAPEKWQKFLDYCIKDVEAERSIRNKLAWLPIMPFERELWALDQHINTTGVSVDLQLIRNAIYMAQINTKALTAEAIELTGLTNPNSAAQLKTWLNDAIGGEEIKTLRKNDIPDLLLRAIVDKDITRVLEIRQEMSKTSVKKYIKMYQSVCADGTLKGLFQFCGANRTWRWAGRGTQVQNLPKNKEKQLETLREALKDNNMDGLRLFGAVPDMLSQLIRTAFIASPGFWLWVSDFSAIEARVIAWLAGENWRLDVFKTHGKIYEASAAAMYKIPLESVTKDQRAIGKVAELALGFQGGEAALEKADYEKKISPDEYPKIKTTWRKANRAIVSMWYEFQNLALHTVTAGRRSIYKIPGTDNTITFALKNDTFFIIIPGGSKLAYPQPRIKEGKYGPALTYMGLDDKSKWRRLDTYGGKLTENIVQGIARNCLANALINVNNAAYRIVMHVHDEIVVEMPVGCGSLKELCDIMGQPAPWAPTLPLRAAGFESLFYKKDD